MAKYKVGDKVRVRTWEDMKKQYGLNSYQNIATPGDSFTTGMEDYCGKEVIIKSVSEYTGYTIYTVKCKEVDTKACWLFTDAMFESKTANTIVIYRKDNQVIALDKLTGKTGIAYCSPEDTFNFLIGADLAYNRLRGRLKPAKEKSPKYYNGEVVCVKTEVRNLTVGKIYKVKDGKFVDNCGRVHGDGYPYVNFRDLNDRHFSDFVEVVR